MPECFLKTCVPKMLQAKLSFVEAVINKNRINCKKKDHNEFTPLGTSHSIFLHLDPNTNESWPRILNLSKIHCSDSILIFTDKVKKLLFFNLSTRGCTM